MDEVFLGDIYGLWTLTFWLSCQDEVSKITNQYYQQVLSGIEAEIGEENSFYIIHSMPIKELVSF